MFEQLDGYLLDGRPSKGRLVAELLAAQASAPARPFLEGIARLGERTPDLALVALRVVLVCGHADDAVVVAVRDAARRARDGDEAARKAYHDLLAGIGTISPK